MSRSTDLLAAAALAFCVGLALPAAAQSPAQQGQGSAVQPAPARPMDDAVPGAGGIQGQNIFDVKPEVKRDASSDPGYLEQNNAQRNAVQPGNNSPMWRHVKSGIEGYSSLPESQAPEAGVLIQAQVQYPGTPVTTAGEAWRQVRNNWLIPYGGALLLISLAALAIYYFTRGPMGHQPAVGGGGRRIERFTPFERAAHWANAIAFVLLAVSGIVMAFGRAFLLPLIGQTLFGWADLRAQERAQLRRAAVRRFAAGHHHHIHQGRVPAARRPALAVHGGRRVQQGAPRTALAPVQCRREGACSGSPCWCWAWSRSVPGWCWTT